MGFYEKKILPWLLEIMESDEMGQQRALTLQNVYGNVLEIGLGTGLNLPYYPKHIEKLTAVEPISSMHEWAIKRIRKSGFSVKWYQSKGDQLPYKKRQFDTVVTTLLLCSVDNIDSVLNEAYRVLKPGGRYYFLEHVISNDPNIRKWQLRLNRIHKVLGCGCELIRDIEQYIRNSKFHVEEIQKVPQFSGIGQKIYPQIRGFAIKPA
jgi:ubiquinone/menaquinone biosynthesis C-methylase UbiE